MSSKQVPDYYDVVKTPIDLSTIRQVITDKSASFFTMKLFVRYCSAGRRMSVCCRFSSLPRGFFSFLKYSNISEFPFDLESCAERVVSVIFCFKCGTTFNHSHQLKMLTSTTAEAVNPDEHLGQLWKRELCSNFGVCTRSY